MRRGRESTGRGWRRRILRCLLCLTRATIVLTRGGSWARQRCHNHRQHCWPTLSATAATLFYSFSSSTCIVLQSDNIYFYLKYLRPYCDIHRPALLTTSPQFDVRANHHGSHPMLLLYSPECKRLSVDSPSTMLLFFCFGFDAHTSKSRTFRDHRSRLTPYPSSSVAIITQICNCDAVGKVRCNQIDDWERILSFTDHGHILEWTPLYYSYLLSAKPAVLLNVFKPHLRK